MSSNIGSTRLPPATSISQTAANLQTQETQFGSNPTASDVDQEEQELVAGYESQQNGQPYSTDSFNSYLSQVNAAMGPTASAMLSSAENALEGKSSPSASPSSSAAASEYGRVSSEVGSGSGPSEHHITSAEWEQQQLYSQSGQGNQTGLYNPTSAQNTAFRNSPGSSGVATPDSPGTSPTSTSGTD